MSTELRILDRADWPPQLAAGELGDIEGPVYLVAGHEMNGEAAFIPAFGFTDPAEALKRVAEYVDVLPKDGEATP